MSNVQEMKQERQQIVYDLFAGDVPSRVLISNPMALDACIPYAGMDIAEVYWDTPKIEAAFDKVCQDFVCDLGPAAGRRFPAYYQILGSKPFIMSSSGHMQHPNVMGMNPEDYDEFIDNPYDCIIDKILPRLYTELDTDSNRKGIILAMAAKALYDDFATSGAIGGKLGAKYGYASIPGGATTAPYDFMADFFRSFTGISGDIRRYPDKVIKACEAITPLLVKKGKLVAPSKFGSTIIPLHMGPYMRVKDFEKFYWPTLKKQVEDLTAMGINVQLFVEDDYTRFIDYLYDLPENTILRFEYGDPKLFAEKLGGKHIISGFYPISLLHTGTKEQCIDEAKRLLDAVMPRCRYWFNTDKGALDIHGNFAENLKAVLEYIYINGKYDNPTGQGQPFEKPGAPGEIIANIDRELSSKSKYFFNYADYRQLHPELEGRPENIIAAKMQRYEDQIYNFIINLCS